MRTPRAPPLRRTISLHLAKTETAIAAAPFGRLPRQDNAGATCTGVNLIEHHVLELLVVHRAHEHVARERLARDATREVVAPVVLETLLDQQLAQHLDVVKAFPTLCKSGAVLA